MRELTLDEVKAIELELVQMVHNICEKNHFRYTLAYGTLLGAVRHQGFIPWDDDVDLIMPRPDYMKFLDYCQKHDVPFGFAANEVNHKYHKAYAKVWDKHTVIEDQFDENKGLDMGANIDIFPVDGLGTGDREEAWRRLKPYVYRNKILAATSWGHYSRSATHSIKYEPIRFALYIYTRLLNADKYAERYSKQVAQFDYESSELVACIGATKTPRAIKNRTIYESYVDLPFEGHHFKAIKTYDQFLKETYGEYMKLPPAEEQNPHHRRKVYMKEG